MRLISAILPAVLPGFPAPQSRAPWPVWRGSVTGPVKFMPMSRKEAAQIWHAARRWDRETRQPGRHGGIIGRTALNVLYVLLFDFLNHQTGRCDPSLDRIAYQASMSRRTVVNALARLRDLGTLSWQRRCEEDRDEAGRFRLRQRTNAYVVLPLSQWVGYRKNDPPPPDPSTLGAPEPVLDPLEVAVAETMHGQRKAAITALEADPNDALAAALAMFGRAIDERESGGVAGVHLPQRNTTPDSNQSGVGRFAAPPPPNTDLAAVKRYWLHALLGPDGSG